MNQTLLAKLICLKCRRQRLRQDADALICQGCRQRVPIASHIPNFLDSYPPSLRDGAYVNAPSWRSPTQYEGKIEAARQRGSLDRIDRPLEQHIKGDVLEIGCGTARLSALVKKRSARYFGLDPSASFLRHAHRSHGLDTLVCGCGELLPFADESFDTLLSGFYAFRYVDPGSGLAEARRVLKTGGVFVFDLLNFWMLQLVMIKNLRFKYSFTSPGQTNTFDFVHLSEMERRARDNDFSIEEIMSAPIVPSFASHNEHVRGFYFRGRRTVYLGYNVIIALRAV